MCCSTRSCPWPLLFLTFINDLPAVSKKLNFYLFADDTNIYFDADKLEKIEKVVNTELRKVNRWLILNKLAFNIEKSPNPPQEF